MMGQYEETLVDAGNKLARQCLLASWGIVQVGRIGAVIAYKQPGSSSEFFIASAWESGRWFNLADAGTGGGDLAFLILGIRAEWARLLDE